MHIGVGVQMEKNSVLAFQLNAWSMVVNVSATITDKLPAYTDKNRDSALCSMQPVGWCGDNVSFTDAVTVNGTPQEFM